MLTSPRLRCSLDAWIGVIFAAFFALSYTPFSHPHYAWIHQLIGIGGFTLWVKDYPTQWWILHALSYVTLFWLIYPLMTMGQLSSISAFLLVFSLISFLTFLKSYPMGYFTSSFPRYGIYCCGIYWIVFEYIQIHFIHFPWILWAQVQGPSPLTGLLSPIPTLLWSGIMLCAWEFLSSYTCMYLIVPCLITYLNFFPIEKIKDLPPLSFSVIQGNINKVEAINQYAHERKALHKEHLKHYLDISLRARSADMLIWPECIIGSVYALSVDDLETIIQSLSLPMPSLVGASFNSFGFDNTAVFVNRQQHFIRSKKYYVPLGETTPPWLIALLENIAPHLEHQKLLPGELSPFELRSSGKTYTFLAMICYESMFAAYITLPHVDWFVILSENIWFDKTFALYQQLCFAQLIAHVNHTPVILSSNNGITAWINASGQIQQALVPQTSDVLYINWKITQ